ncbi:hypothetical protein N7891_004191 [Vibrio vulnificus]|nr:hypothetical protein [Vibrio vulnificus]
MDYIQISEWLKNTIPGIIILGAIGSIAAGVVIWLLSKLAKVLMSLNRYLVVQVFGANVAKFCILYLRQYYTLRATISQLFNKEQELPLVVIHQRFLANRNLSCFAALLFSITAILLFLLHETDFPKATASFVALSILCINDTIAYGVWANRVAKFFYGNEESVAEETYKTKESVLLERALSIASLKKSA